MLCRTCVDGWLSLFVVPKHRSRSSVTRIDVAIANVPVVPARPGEAQLEAELYTDSSADGWGAVICVDGRIASYGERWTDEEKAGRCINALEAMAVGCGIRAFQRDLEGRHVLVAVDNRAAATAVDVSTSTSKTVSTAAEVSANLLDRITAGWRMCWIATARNPSDEPSRDKPVDNAKAIEARAHATPLHHRTRQGWRHRAQGGRP